MTNGFHHKKDTGTKRVVKKQAAPETAKPKPAQSREQK